MARNRSKRVQCDDKQQPEKRETIKLSERERERENENQCKPSFFLNPFTFDLLENIVIIIIHVSIQTRFIPENKRNKTATNQTIYIFRLPFPLCFNIIMG